MSRLWDTPEYWARFEADELLRDYPDDDVNALADMFERTLGSYDDDPALARDTISELRRRADAGIRFWPAVLSLVRPHVSSAVPCGDATSLESEPSQGAANGLPQ